MFVCMAVVSLIVNLIFFHWFPNCLPENGTSVDMNRLTPTKSFDTVTNYQSSSIAAIFVSMIIKFRAEVLIWRRFSARTPLNWINSIKRCRWKGQNICLRIFSMLCLNICSHGSLGVLFNGAITLEKCVILEWNTCRSNIQNCLINITMNICGEKQINNGIFSLQKRNSFFLSLSLSSTSVDIAKIMTNKTKWFTKYWRLEKNFGIVQRDHVIREEEETEITDI